LVDLDGDGIIDIISGSWPGELFFFRGKGKGEFAAPIKLKDKFGKTINVGGGLRKNAGDMILVAGDASFEKNDKGNSVIIYEDQRIEIPPDKQGGITGTASSVHAVDWDGDGKMDLLVGEIGGRVYLLRNDSTAKKLAFAKEQQLEAGGKPLLVAGDAGPFACDWDGDGKIDLLVGAGDGSVWFYRNTGTSTAPKLAAGVQLVGPGEYGPTAAKEPRRGIRAKVCAVDWNGDGRLDLLVGDFTTQKATRPDPTPKVKAEQDKLKKELESVQTRYRELIPKLHGPSRVKDKKESARIEGEMQKTAARMQELHRLVPQETENHGWVWLFLRRPAEAVGARK